MNRSQYDLDNQQPPLTPVSQLRSEIRLKIIGDAKVILSQIEQLSPASLAYLGDAVYELYVRTHHLLPPKRAVDYHNQVVAQVRAETQAQHLTHLEPYLTETERDILRKGRNAATGKPRRLSPTIYQQATSLETLIGYLYLQDPHRLNQLLDYLKFPSL